MKLSDNLKKIRKENNTFRIQMEEYDDYDEEVE